MKLVKLAYPNSTKGQSVFSAENGDQAEIWSSEDGCRAHGVGFPADTPEIRPTPSEQRQVRGETGVGAAGSCGSDDPKKYRENRDTAAIRQKVGSRESESPRIFSGWMPGASRAGLPRRQAGNGRDRTQVPELPFLADDEGSAVLVAPGAARALGVGD